MRKYTVKDLCTLLHNDVQIKFISKRFLLAQNHIVDWYFPAGDNEPKKAYIVLKGKHLARLV